LDQAEAASESVPGWQRDDLEKLFTRARNLLANDGNVEVRRTDAVTVPEGLAKIAAGEDAALVAAQWAQHRNDYVQGKTTEASPWTAGKAAATIRDSRTVGAPVERLRTAYRQLDRSGQGYVRIPDLARAAGLTPEETRGALAELDDAGEAYLTPADEPRNIPEADRPFLVNGPSGKALFVTMLDMPAPLQSPSGHAQPLGEVVMTPHGELPIGKLYKGAQVTTNGGYSTTVTGTFPQGEKPVFRVTLSDGRSTRATANHLWMVDNGSILTTADIKGRKVPALTPPS
jgi:hypothetical protein